MANGIGSAGLLFPLVDQALLEQGQQGAQGPARVNPRPDPSMFAQTSQNLFGEIELGAGGRRGDILGTLFGGLLPPSKKQREAFELRKQERAQALERARSGVEAQARAAGIRLPRGEPEATKRGQVFEAAARQEPGGREAFETLLAQGPTGRLARRTAESQLRADLAANEIRRAMLPLDVQETIDARLRAQTAFNIKNFRDFQTDVRQNVSMEQSIRALTSFQQLRQVLDNPQASALDIQNAIVAMAQILEPGLAVRNDDRIAISGSASTGLKRLSNFYNQLISGKIDPEQFKTNAIRSATGLITPRIQALRQGVDFYDEIADNIPGVKVGDAANIIGLTPQAEALMNEVAPISDFDLTGGG